MTAKPAHPLDSGWQAGTAEHLAAVLRLKYGPRPEWGWGPRLRERFGYVSPDEWYEATVFGLVAEHTDWLDVGCGRNIFPFNYPTAEVLAQRCHHLVGVDPSSNIDLNTLVHERARCLLQDYRSEQTFDLITMRMVAEHITDPAGAVGALARLTRPGGHVVIYTVWKWSPASMLAALTPLSAHVAAKRLLWGSAQRDTFPTAYKMNTRADLLRHMSAAGFVETGFTFLDDCRSLAQVERLAQLELRLWRMLRTLRLRYPERCILATYRRLG